MHLLLAEHRRASRLRSRRCSQSPWGRGRGRGPRCTGAPLRAPPTPKSTGREDFGRHFFEPLFRRHRRVAPSDMARSLLAATARVSLTASRDRRIQGLREIVLSGGGAENPVLVAEVTRCFPETHVAVVTSGVFAPACHEPAAMALIAARTLSRLPSSLRGDGRLTARHLGARCLAFSLARLPQILTARSIIGAAIRPLNLTGQARSSIGEAWLARRSGSSWLNG